MGAGHRRIKQGGQTGACYSRSEPRPRGCLFCLANASLLPTPCSSIPLVLNSVFPDHQMTHSLRLLPAFHLSITSTEAFTDSCVKDSSHFCSSFSILSPFSSYYLLPGILHGIIFGCGFVSYLFPQEFPFNGSRDLVSSLPDMSKHNRDSKNICSCAWVSGGWMMNTFICL